MRPSKYPYERWLKKRRFTLIKHQDYEIQSHCLGIMLRRQARQRNLRLSIITHNNPERIEVTVEKEVNANDNPKRRLKSIPRNRSR